jgi:hypothetical protein
MNNKFKITFYTFLGKETYFTDHLCWTIGDALAFKNENGKEMQLKGLLKVEEQ